MNLFRSEEHARRWEQFDPGMEHMLLPVSGWANMFSAGIVRGRLRDDYLTWLRTDEGRAVGGEFREKMPKPLS